jgi:hypothetical protein
LRILNESAKIVIDRANFFEQGSDKISKRLRPNSLRSSSMRAPEYAISLVGRIKLRIRPEKLNELPEFD